MMPLNMPRPSIQRADWFSLDGAWRFQVDAVEQGIRNGWFNGLSTEAVIQVPYAAGSRLSGQDISHDVQVVWYERAFMCPEWQSEEVLLTFGAVDYRSDVWVNGHHVGQHVGGYTPFSMLVGPYLKAGENRIVVRCEDPLSWEVPRGKQAAETRWPIDYDGVIGPWQSVWLEAVPSVYVEHVHSRFDLDASVLQVNVGLSRNAEGRVTIRLNHGESAATVELSGRREAKLSLEISDPRLWSPEDPYLYDVQCSFQLSPSVSDDVQSYCALRSVSFQADGFYLNGERRFLRGVLDQGYFQDGWYTPPDESALIKDIEQTLALGFNLTRKHQKIEDPRFYYWADRLGLMVWAEMPSGRIFSSQLKTDLTHQWMEVLAALQHHPSIVAWVPFNESWGVWNQATRTEQQDWVASIYHLTKALDPSRPVIANDGWEFVVGDAWTLHLYQQDPQSLLDRLGVLISSPAEGVADGARAGALRPDRVEGLPLLITECGGVGFDPSRPRMTDDFAYGEWPQSEAEFKARLSELLEALNRSDRISGFVWTQLTDVAQEINGLLYFDRTPKVDIDWLCAQVTGRASTGQ
jgi:beta-galactosidase/beta-glucuronidase